jgi:hypothetical protein
MLNKHKSEHQARFHPSRGSVWSPHVQEPSVSSSPSVKFDDSDKYKAKYEAVRDMVRSGASFNKALTKPIKMKLFSNSTVTLSSANTALNSASLVGFNSSTFPELSSIVELYDEARVLRCGIHYIFNDSSNSASASGNFGGIAISYDPSVAAPTSISQICQEAHSTGPLFVQGSYNSSGQTQYPKGKAPSLFAKSPPPLAPITSSDVPGSAWFALDDIGGSSPTIFALLIYCSPLGTSGVSSCNTVVELECEFRMRV